MALDYKQLSPTQLVRLMNSTPLGTVLSSARLHRQMNQAGMRIGDGKTIHLIRYVSWLVQQLEAPRPAPMSYEQRKQREAERNRLKALAGQDIGPLPDVADWDRRQACTKSFRLFCETYFPLVFYRPWSNDHLKVLRKIERCVLSGGLFAFALPRGSGKTVMASLGSLWAVLIGARPFVCLIGGTKDAARKLLDNIKTITLSPQQELLRADFPEALHPLWMLRNNARRQGSQHIDGGTDVNKQLSRQRIGGAGPIEPQRRPRRVDLELYGRFSGHSESDSSRAAHGEPTTTLGAPSSVAVQ